VWPEHCWTRMSHQESAVGRGDCCDVFRLPKCSTYRDSHSRITCMDIPSESKDDTNTKGHQY
jgi:hypothetical protein